jgi:hypothetical protein
MKKTILLIPLVVLLALTLATSTVTASAAKVSFIATQRGAPLTFSPETGINKGEILHIYAVTGGAVNLGNDGVMVFTSSSNLTAIINTKTGEGVIHFEMIWTAKFGGGTFEGQVNGKIIDYTYAPTGYLPDGTAFPAKFGWAGSVHTVFQGSGEFEGQTLMLDGTRERLTPASFTGLMWEGYLLTH